MSQSAVKQKRPWFAALAIAAVLAGGSAMTISTRADVREETPRASAAVPSPEATASARDLSTAFRYASEKVLPSVVAIETKPKTSPPRNTDPREMSPFGNLDRFKGTPFEDFFKDDSLRRHFQFKESPPQSQSRPRGIGSGVIIDAAGVILTNNHVVAGGGEVTVRLHDGREFNAVDVKTDPKTDMAVVRIEGAGNLVAARLGDSEQMQIGDWVLALGQPFGLESTVTAGIVSAKHRGIGITDRGDFLQTDAAINPGNSGGPLINLDGAVIGINTAIHSRSGGNDGIGFAISSDLAKWVSRQLIDRGEVKRAFLGVGIQTVDHQLAEQFNVKPRQGVLITEVHAGTPADKAGLKSGDIIVALNGRPVGSPRELQVMVERTDLDKKQSLTIVRDGSETSVEFMPEALPVDLAGPVKNQGNNRSVDTPLGEMGLELGSLTSDVAEKLGMDGVQGVVITSVEPDSPAAQSGLETGMVITRVNRTSVTSVEELEKAIGDGHLGDGVLLLVRTSDGSRYVVLRP